MMRKQDIFDVVYTHTEGEPLCIIHSGIPYPAGSTILEKRAFLEANYDWVRQALMREPRGHKDMFGVFLTPPSSPDYDAGLIYIDGTQYSHMCGHGTIAVAMAMVALGMVPRNPDGVTTIRFETTAGPGAGRSRLRRRRGAVDPLRERAGLCGGAGRAVRAAGHRPAQGRHRVGRQLFRHHRPARHLAAHLAGERLGAVALRHHGARADPPAGQHPAPDCRPHQQLQLRHLLARADHRRRVLQERPCLQRRPARPLAGRHRHQRDDGDVRGARPTRASTSRSAPRACSAPAPSRAA